jgi:hypothetical protein
MADIQVQLRRGTATQHNTFTGAVGEVTVDTTNDTLRVHDGSTAGGVRLAKLSEAAGGTGTVTSVGSGAGLTGGPITTSGTLSIENGGVDTTQLANDAVTFAKMQNINTAKVIGRTAAGAGDPQEVSILDEDAMTSNSATALATQQSIKAYVDAQIGGSLSKAAITDTNTPTAYGSVTYTHNLGTDDISYDIYARDSNGVEHNIKSEIWAGTVSAGATVTNITSTQITIKYLEKWLDWTGATSVSDPNPDQKNWSDASLIKIVVIG